MINADLKKKAMVAKLGGRKFTDDEMMQYWTYFREYGKHLVESQAYERDMLKYRAPTEAEYDGRFEEIELDLPKRKHLKFILRR